MKMLKPDKDGGEHLLAIALEQLPVSAIGERHVCDCCRYMEE
jgi:hypothetical protein